MVRRLAAENGVDLATLQGSGSAGRIRREDVEQAISARLGRGRARPPPAPAAGPGRPGPGRPRAAPRPRGRRSTAGAASTDPRDQVEPLSRMRLAVAEGMVASLATSAHVWTSVEVDFDNVERVRVKHKDRFKKEVGASLSYLPFVSRATIDALRVFPAVNSSIDVPARPGPCTRTSTSASPSTWTSRASSSRWCGTPTSSTCAASRAGSRRWRRRPAARSCRWRT